MTFKSRLLLLFLILILKCQSISLSAANVTDAPTLEENIELDALSASFVDETIDDIVSASVSRRQYKEGTGNGATATFDSAPIQGNLLVVIGGHRKDAQDNTISGSGWTQHVYFNAFSGDSNSRRGMAIWTKIAGANEPLTITTDVGSSLSKILIQEFEVTGGTFTTIDQSASNQGTTSGSTWLSTGTTPTTTSANTLVIGAMVGRYNCGNTPNFGNGLHSSIGSNEDTSDYPSMWSGFVHRTSTGTQDSPVSWTNSILSSAGIIAYKIDVSGGGSGGNCNVVNNHEFDSGSTDWTLSNNGAGTGVSTLIIDNSSQLSGVYSAEVDIDVSSSAAWHIQLYQDNHTIDASKNYNISFRARATANRSIGFRIQEGASPWTTYYSVTQNITTSAQTYTFNNISVSGSSSIARLIFELGLSTADVYIDEVIFEEVGCQSGGGGGSCDSGYTLDHYGEGCSGSGINITVPNLSNVIETTIENVYKGCDPGSSVTVSSSIGNLTLNEVSVAGGSSQVRVYRTVVSQAVTNINATSDCGTCGTGNGLQSMMVYAKRSVNNNVGYSTVTMDLSGYCDIETFNIPISTSTAPRDVDVVLPLSEITDDGRYLTVVASSNTGSATATQTIFGPDLSLGCCFYLMELTIPNVPANTSAINISIITDGANNPNGSSCGQSYAVGGTIYTATECPCEDLTDGGTIGSDESNCGSYNPALITNVTLPSGGEGSFIEYQWQQRNMPCGGSWSSWATLSSATSSTYDPSTIGLTTQYRRRAKRDACGPYVYSNTVTKEVVQAFTNAGTIGNNESKCGGYDPANIVSLTAPSGGCGGTISYLWQTRSLECGGTWSSFSNIPNSNAATYNPGPITKTTRYRRLSRRGACSWIYSSEVVKEVIEQYTTAGTIAGNQSLCGGYDPTTITSTSLGTGGCGGTPNYLWQKRSMPCGGSYGAWSNISSNTATYNPPAITETTQYRRLERRTSGCSPGWLYSAAVTKEVLVQFTNGGTIAGDQALCGGYNPSNITSTTLPTGGCGGTPYYVWQKRDKVCDGNYSGWSTISGANSTTYDPGAITQTTQYRRISRRISGCTPSWAYSNTVTKDVIEQYTTAGTIGGNQSLCGGYDPTTITSTSLGTGGCGGTPSYLWQKRSMPCGGSYGAWSNISSNTATYNPPAITETTQYRRLERRTSGCSPTWLYSAAVTKEVVQQTTGGGTITGNETQCGGYDPGVIGSTAPATGGCGGTIAYYWGRRTVNCDGTKSAFTNWWDGETYNPGPITQTTEYIRRARRIGGCSPSWSYTNYILKEVVEQYTSAGSIAGNETVCGDSFDPAPITSSADPSGGCHGTETHVWQRSVWNCTTGAFGAWENFGVTNVLTYDPPVITATTKYRRVSYRNSTCTVPWVITNEVTKRLQKQFTGPGTISGDESKCSGFNPANITSTAPPTGGCDGTLAYNWQYREYNCATNSYGSWISIAGSNAASYNPPAITVTTQYRRQAKNGDGCGPAWRSSGTVTKEIVQPYTSGGSITGDESLCASSFNPGLISSTALPSGGCGGTQEIRWYKWEMNCATGSYGSGILISGATSESYNPPTITTTTRYRRYARLASDCTGTNGSWYVSNYVYKYLLSDIADGGSISADQEECGSYIPNLLVGTVPTGGCANQSVTYLWQYRFGEGGAWVDIPGTNTKDYQPGLSTISGQYRRKVNTESCGELFSNEVTLIVNNPPTATMDNSSFCPSESTVLEPEVCESYPDIHSQRLYQTSSWGTELYGGGSALTGDGSLCFDLTDFSATTNYQMIGLNSDPATNEHFNSIDYAMYIVPAVNNYRVIIYESGTSRGTKYTSATSYLGSTFCVRRTGTTIEYLKDDVVIFTSAVASNANLYYDNSFHSGNASQFSKFENINLCADASDIGMTYAWSGGGSGATKTVSSTGTYTVTVTDDHGCNTTASASVTQDTPPNATLNKNRDLSCTYKHSYLYTTVNYPDFPWTFTEQMNYETSGASCGSKYLNIVGQAPYSTMTQTEGTITANASYTFDLKYKKSGSGAAYARIVWYQTDWTYISVSQTTLNTTGSWTTATVTANAPANAGRASVQILVYDNATVDVDCLSFKKAGGSELLADSSLEGNSPFQWSGPNGSMSGQRAVYVVNPGTYTVTVTDPNTGCTATSSITVNQDITPPNASASNDGPLTCANTSVTLTATSTTTGATYAWSGGGTNATKTVTDPGTYTVTVTDPSNGCTATAQTIVVQNNTPTNVYCQQYRTLPQGGVWGPWTPFGANCEIEICEDDGLTDIQVDGGPNINTGWVWEDEDGNIDSEVDEQVVFTNIDPSDAGTYTATLTNSNGCVSSFTFDVIVNPNPVAAATNNGPLTCALTTVTMTATPAGMNYLWSSGGTAQTETTTTPGTYTVTVTNSNGCTDTAQTTVSQNITPPVASASNDGPITCDNTDVTLTALPAGKTYAWSGGGTGQTKVVTSGGTYTVTVTDTNGCTDTAQTVVVENNDPTNVFCQQYRIQLQGEAWGPWTPFGANCEIELCELDGLTDIQVDGGPNINTGWVWKDEDNNIDSEVDEQVVFTNIDASDAGTYSATLTNSNGCVSSFTFDVIVIATATASVTGDSQVCVGETATLNGSTTGGLGTASYQWQSSVNNTTWENISGATSINYTTPAMNATMHFRLVVTWDGNGCSDVTSAAATVNVDTESIALTADAFPPSICPGGSTILTVNDTINHGGLINYNNWSTGTGSTAGFPANGAANENHRIMDTDPWGNSTVVWEARPDGSGNADGGWNTDFYDIDHTKLYRVSVWVNRKVIGTNGRFYLGTHAKSGSVNEIKKVSNNEISTNPYFWYSAAPPTTLEQDEWVLIVGHIYPSNHTGTSLHTDSGRYTLDQGKVGNTHQDFKWLTTSTTARHRSYLYYSTDNTSRQQWVYPRFDVVDGTEPSIDDILGGFDVNGGLGENASWEWYTGSCGGTSVGTGESITVSPSATTTYYVRGEGGCNTSACTSVTVTVNTPPTASASHDGNITCADENSTMTALPAGMTYAWSGGGTGQTKTVTSPGTYTVTVTDENGCTDTAQTTVGENITPTNIYCERYRIYENGVWGSWINFSGNCEIEFCEGVGAKHIQFDGGPNINTGWVWKDEDGNTDSEVDEIVQFSGLTTDDSGTYTGELTNQYGCISNISFDVIVNPNPVAAASNNGPLTCALTTVTMTATPAGMNYAWSSGGTGQTETTSVPGTYIVTVTDSNGCSDTAETIVSQDISNPTANAGPDDDICTGEDAVLMASGGGTYTWSNGLGSTATVTVSPTSTTTYTVTVTASNGCTDTDQVTITVNPLPTADPGANGSVCSGNTLSWTAQNAGTGATYAWNFGTNATPATASGIGPHVVTYSIPSPGTTNFASSTTVTVTSSDGCVNQGSDAFTILAVPQVTLSDTELTCGNDDGTITVTFLDSPNRTGIEFTIDGGSNWTSGINDNAGSHTFTGLSAGTYDVDVRWGDNNCRLDVGSVTLDPMGTPNVSASNDGPLTCDKVNVTLTATSTSTGITYAWSGGGSNATKSVTAPGTYTVTVTDSTTGCTNTAQTIVTQDIADPNASATNNGPITCDQPNVTLTASSTTSGATFNWSNGLGSNATASVNAPGTYTVTVTDPNNGCTATAQTIVIEDTDAPNAGASNDGPLTCANLSVELTATSTTPGATFAWSGGGTNTTKTVSAPGTYTVTVTDPTNGCTSTAQTIVIQNNTPTNIYCDRYRIREYGVWGAWVNFNGNCDIVLCEEDGLSDIEFDGGPNINTGWVWKDEDGNQDGEVDEQVVFSNIDLSDAGTYTGELTNQYGCISNISFEVIVNPNPDAGATNNGPLTCALTSVTMTATPAGMTYSWSSGGTSQTESTTLPGTYTVTVTDPMTGCSDTAQTTVTQDISAPTADAGANSSICHGDDIELTASGGGTYQWSHSGGTNSTFTVSPTSTTTYTVTVTDPSNGCTDEASITITVNPLPTVTVATTDATCEEDNGTATATPSGGQGPYTYDWSLQNFELDFATIVGDKIPNTMSLDSATNVNGSVASGYVTLDNSTDRVQIPNSKINGLTDFDISIDFYMSSVNSLNSILSVANSSQNNALLFAYNNNTSRINIYIMGDTETYAPASALSTNQWYNLQVVRIGDQVEVFVDGTSLGAKTMNANTVVSDYACLGEEQDSVDGGYDANQTLEGRLDNLLIKRLYQNDLATITGLAPGIIDVIITDANGCSATGSGTIDEIPTTIASATNNGPITCSFPNVTLTALPAGMMYAWSGGGSEQTKVVTTGGTYTVTVTDSNGCTSTAQTTVVENNTPTPIFCERYRLARQDIGWGPWIAFNGNCDIVLCEDDGLTNIQFDGGPDINTGWVWKDEDGNIDDEVDEIVQFVDIGLDDAGTYTGELTNSNGCVSNISFNVIVNPNPNATVVKGRDITCTTLFAYAYPTANYPGAPTYLQNSEYVSGGASCGSQYLQSTGTSPYSIIAHNLPNSVTGGNSYEFGFDYKKSGGTVVARISWYETGYVYLSTTSVTLTDANSWTAGSVSAVAPANAANVQISFLVYGNAQLDSDCWEFGPQGGSPSYTEGFETDSPYEWSGPNGFTGSSRTMYMTEPGTYTVTVTDPNTGCTDTGSVTIDLYNTPPNASATNDGPITCTQPNVTLTASSTTSGATYNWSNGLGSDATASVSAPGTYTVTVTDPSNGCTATAQTIVTEDTDAPNASATNDGPLTCVNLSVELTATSTTPGATFAWSGGGTGATKTVSDPGTYTVTVTDPSNGCTSTAETIVIQNNTPTNVYCQRYRIGYDGVWESWTNFSGNCEIEICENDGLYDIQFDGGPDVNTGWVWTDEDGNIDSEVDELVVFADIGLDDAGIYTGILTNEYGCESTVTFEVIVNENPVASASNDGPLTCAKTTVTMTATPAGMTYAWSGGGTSQTKTTTTPGTFTVTVTDTNGCTDTAETIVTQDISNPTADAGPDDVICNGEDANLTASGGGTYAWSNGLGSNPNVTVSPTSTTTYTVTVTSANGCTDTDQVIVTVNPLPVADPGTNANICTGNTLTWTASDAGVGASYDWDFGPYATPSTATGIGPHVVTYNSPDPNVNQATQTELTVTSSDGCINDGSDAFTILAIPQVTLSDTDLTCGNDDGTITVSFLDSPNRTGIEFSINGGTNWTSGIQDNAGSYTFTGLSAGTYDVDVRWGDNSCPLDVGTVIIDSKPLPTVTASNDLTICPDGTTTISASADGGSGMGYIYNWDNGLGNGSSHNVTINTTTTYTVTVTDSNGCVDTDQVTITVAPAPQVTVNVQDATICAGETTTITSSISGGTGTASYQWQQSSLGDIWTDISGATATTYTTPALNASNNYRLVVSYTGTGCDDVASAAGTVTVENPSAVVDAISDEEEICLGGSAILSVNSEAKNGGLIDYSTWTVGTGSETGFAQVGGTSENNRINDIDPWGNTTVVWQGEPNGNGNSDGGWNTDRFDVDNSKLYRFSVWVNRKVLGTDGRFYLGTKGYGSTNGLKVVTNGGTSTNPYFWTSAQGGTNLLEDEWILVVGHVFPSDHTGTTRHAESGRYTANGGFIAATSLDFAWLPETTESLHRSFLYYADDPSARQQLVYPRVDVVDGSEPSIDDLLNGFDVNGGLGEGASYEWFTGSCGGTLVGTGETITVSPTVTTTYYVRATGDCNTTACESVTVTVNSLPMASATNDGPLTCAKTTAVLTATPSGLNYEWSTNETTETITVNSPGTYTVTVTDGSGCISTATTTVTQDITPPVANAGNDQEICESEDITLTATGGGTYMWSNSAGNTASVIVNPSSTTTYTVTVTASNGCTDTDEVTVEVNQGPTAPGTIAGDEEACGSYDPAIITSENDAVGEVGLPISYNWQMRELSCTSGQWSAWSDIVGAHNSDYDSPQITTTTQYRRLAGQQGCSSSWLISNVITKDVIINSTNPGTIAADQTGCDSFDPDEITGGAASGGCGGTLEYQWQMKISGGTWTDISGATGMSYDPGTVTETTEFQRLVRSLPCPYVASNIVVMTINSAEFTAVALGSNLDCEGNCTGTIDVEVDHALTGDYMLEYTFDGNVTQVGPFTQNEATISNLCAGAYSNIRVISNTTGCIDTWDGGNISISESHADWEHVTHTDDVSDCHASTCDGSFTVDANMGVTGPYMLKYTYEGVVIEMGPYTSAGDILIDNLCAGNYSDITITSIESGCTDVWPDDIVIATPDFDATVLGEIDDDCQINEGSVTLRVLNGVYPYTVEWRNEDSTDSGTTTLNQHGNITIYGLTGGETYCFKVTDSNGCVEN